MGLLAKMHSFFSIPLSIYTETPLSIEDPCMHIRLQSFNISMQVLEGLHISATLGETMLDEDRRTQFRGNLVSWSEIENNGSICTGL